MIGITASLVLKTIWTRNHGKERKTVCLGWTSALAQKAGQLGNCPQNLQYASIQVPNSAGILEMQPETA